MDQSRLTQALWVSGFVGNISLFCIMVMRGQWRRFRIFTGLAGYEVVRTIALFTTAYVIPKHAHLYFATYWVSETGDVLLQLALLWEIFTISVSHRFGGRMSLSLSSWALIITAIAVAGMFSLVLPPSDSMKHTVDMRASLFTSLLVCELFVLVSFLVNRLGIRRGRHVMAISQGMAAWASLSVAGTIIHQVSGWADHAVLFDQLQSLVALYVLGSWIWTFWTSERQTNDGVLPLDACSIPTNFANFTRDRGHS